MWCNRCSAGEAVRRQPFRAGHRHEQRTGQRLRGPRSRVHAFPRGREVQPVEAWTAEGGARRAGHRRCEPLRYAAVTAVRGEPYFLVAELEWDSMDELRAAVASPQGRATAADVDKLRQSAGVRSMIIGSGDDVL